MVLYHVSKICKSLLCWSFMTKNTSIFTRIIRRELPADIIHEDDSCIVIEDINKVAPEHFLVIPKEPIKGLDECSEDKKEILGHLMVIVNKIAQEKSLIEGYRVVINIGSDGGQEVPHLHIHVMGKRKMSWPPG